MTPEYAAYLAAVRRIAWPLRLAGLGLILLGALATIWAKTDASIRPLGFAAFGLGWGLFGYAFYVRLRFEREHPFTGERE